LSFVPVSLISQLFLGGNILDTRISYSFEDVTDLFTQLGTEGLQFYSVLHLCDTLFPIAYGITIAFAIGYLSRNIPEEKLQFVMLIPILAIICDFAENILIETQIAAYPILSEQVIVIASIMTSIKWISLIAGIFVIIILACVNYLKEK